MLLALTLAVAPHGLARAQASSAKACFNLWAGRLTQQLGGANNTGSVDALVTLFRDGIAGYSACVGLPLSLEVRAGAVTWTNMHGRKGPRVRAEEDKERPPAAGTMHRCCWGCTCLHLVANRLGVRLLPAKRERHPEVASWRSSVDLTHTTGAVQSFPQLN